MLQRYASPPAVAERSVPPTVSVTGFCAVPIEPFPARRRRLPAVWIAGLELPARMLPGAVMSTTLEGDVALIVPIVRLSPVPCR